MAGCWPRTFRQIADALDVPFAGFDQGPHNIAYHVLQLAAAHAIDKPVFSWTLPLTNRWSAPGFSLLFAPIGGGKRAEVMRSPSNARVNSGYKCGSPRWDTGSDARTGHANGEHSSLRTMAYSYVLALASKRGGPPSAPLPRKARGSPAAGDGSPHAASSAQELDSSILNAATCARVQCSTCVRVLPEPATWTRSVSMLPLRISSSTP